MLLVSAFPCLGKTTLYKINKQVIFDSEFNETKSIKELNEEQIFHFFRACADIVELRNKNSNSLVQFITDDDRLLQELYIRGIKPILVFPDIFDESYLKEYRKKVIERSGKEWFEQVVRPKIQLLPDRIQKYSKLGYEIRYINHTNPYLENVIDFSEEIKRYRQTDS